MHTRSEFTQDTSSSDHLWTPHLNFCICQYRVHNGDTAEIADLNERRCHDHRVNRKHKLLCGQSILFEGTVCVLIVVLVAYRGLKLANAFSRLFDSSGAVGKCGG